MWGLVSVHLERRVLPAAAGAKALMENDSAGESKTGARPLVAASFLYIRDRERAGGGGGEGQLYQETLNLVSRTGCVERGEMVDGMDVVIGL